MDHPEIIISNFALRGVKQPYNDVHGSVASMTAREDSHHCKHLWLSTRTCTVGSGGSLKPTPRPALKISYEKVIIWSQ